MAIDVSINPSLVWEGVSATDGSAVSYTVLLDKSSDLEGVLPTAELETNLTANFCTVTSPLVGGEENQWYDLATSAYGDSRNGSLLMAVF